MSKYEWEHGEIKLPTAEFAGVRQKVQDAATKVKTEAFEQTQTFWKGLSRKPLSIREWTCGGCQTRLDRDYNAAVNIMVAAGLAETLNACGPGIRRTLACAVGDEAGTHRSEAAA